MKKLACIAFVLITGFTFAQEKMQSKQKTQDYTPEERAQLQTKQMTLDLDLNTEQQKQVGQLLLENANAKSAKKAENTSTSKQELSKDEKLQMKNERLDHQIEMKKKMKDILDKDQYTKWEKMNEEKKEQQKKGMHQKKKASMSKQTN